MIVTNLIRSTKRKFLTKGYAKTVYLFLKEIEKKDDKFIHPTSKYLVNLSFDFEFGLGSTFWGGNIKKSLSYGRTARKNFAPIMEYLEEEKIPANVQVVGALLYPQMFLLPIFNELQQEVISKNKELFMLAPRDVELLKSSNIEVGIHGFSHRHFTTFSKADAEYEMSNAVKSFKGHFGKSPEFMGFPKNLVAHTDIIQKYGIKCWRADNEHPRDKLEIPLGHWFAPGVFGKNDIKKFLATIKGMRSGYFLHLWGHFTEMNLEIFKELVGVIQDAGWELTTVKDFKKY